MWIIFAVITVLIGAATWVLSNVGKEDKTNWGIVGGGATLIIVVIILGFMMGIVPTGNAGLVMDFGGKRTNRVLDPGFYCVAPLQSVVQYSVRQQVLTLDKIDGESKDKQEVVYNMTFYVNITKESLVNLFDKYGSGDAYLRNLVIPVLTSAAKEAGVQYNAMELGTGNSRSQIASDAVKIAAAQLNKEGVSINNAILNSYNYPDAAFNQLANNVAINSAKKLEADAKIAVAEAEGNANIVEAKKKAEADMVAAKNNNEITILNAKATAEANNILAKSITTPLINMKMAENWKGINFGNSIANIDKETLSAIINGTTTGGK